MIDWLAHVLIASASTLYHTLDHVDILSTIVLNAIVDFTKSVTNGLAFV